MSIWLKMKISLWNRWLVWIWKNAGNWEYDQPQPKTLNKSMKKELKLIFTESFYNECPKCKALIKMNYYSDGKKDIYVGFCKKCFVLFIALI